jgi:hypothetical protein
MVTIVAKLGKKIEIPSRLNFPLGLKVYVQAELPEEVIVEPEENLDGYNPTVVLHLKPKNDCKKLKKEKPRKSSRFLDPTALDHCGFRGGTGHKAKMTGAR